VVAEKLNEPVPVLVTLSVAGAGLAPPAVALNARLAGATDKTGCGAPSVKVTVTIFGEPCAPFALVVMWPV
jgi:hypothetical protein